MRPCKYPLCHEPGDCSYCDEQYGYGSTTKESLPLLALLHDRQRRRRGARSRQAQRQDQGPPGMLVCLVGLLISRAIARISRRALRPYDKQDD